MSNKVRIVNIRNASISKAFMLDEWEVRSPLSPTQNLHDQISIDRFLCSRSLATAGKKKTPFLVKLQGPSNATCQKFGKWRYFPCHLSHLGGLEIKLARCRKTTQPHFPLTKTPLNPPWLNTMTLANHQKSFLNTMWCSLGYGGGIPTILLYLQELAPEVFK